MTARLKALDGWLHLIRPPNLPTVPGDPIVGLILAQLVVGGTATFVQVVSCALSALLLYMSGLILNDVADLKEDKATRPDRPLASGAVSVRAAILVGVLLGLAGVGVSAFAGWPAFAVAALLWGSVLTYDFVTRRWAPIGLLNMGLCRGLSVCLGAAAVGREALTFPVIGLVAGGWLVYIVTVSLVAVGETETRRLRVIVFLPTLAILLLCGGLYRVVGNIGLAAWVVLGAAALRALIAGVALLGTPSPKQVGQQIGVLIRVLLPVQAGCCLMDPDVGYLAGLCLLLLWPVATSLGKTFYAS